jgi:hypothetical protein
MQSPVGTQELSRAFARAPKLVSEIDELLYLYLSLYTLSPSSYMFCSSVHLKL